MELLTKELLLSMGQEPNLTDWGMDNCVSNIIQIETNHMYLKYSCIQKFSSVLLSTVSMKVVCPSAAAIVYSGKAVFYLDSYYLMSTLQVMLLHVWIC